MWLVSLDCTRIEELHSNGNVFFFELREAIVLSIYFDLLDVEVSAEGHNFILEHFAFLIRDNYCPLLLFYLILCLLKLSEYLFVLFLSCFEFLI